MIDANEARKRWLEERQTYGEFGQLIAARLKEAVHERGIWCETSSRAKEPHSLIKKLLKGKHTYDSLPDKAGVRCVARHLSELDIVLSQARGLFDCSDVDIKLLELEADRIGYTGIHVQVRLTHDDPELPRFPSKVYSAELQIRTLGQHLWSEMSHDSFYKNDETLTALPFELKRRVYLMAGLIEVADQEFDRLNGERTLNPEIELYKSLERHYYTLTAKRPDPALSLEVIKLLLPLFGGDDVPHVTQHLDRFFDAHKDILQHVYREAEDWTASPFLFQPEVLMIYERLEADPMRTRREWVRQFPEDELERIAVAFGISFD